VSVVTAIGLGLIVVAAGLCLTRLVRPASLPDRLVGLDTLLVMIACGIGMWTARTGDGIYVDVMVVVSLIAFAATVTVARFIERRGSR
jgi:multicomponent Na+:H+ antiporter subunit F